MLALATFAQQLVVSTSISTVLLALVVAAVLFGVGAVVFGRRKSPDAKKIAPETAPALTRETARETAPETVRETVPEKQTLQNPLDKLRATFTNSFVNLLTRSAITDQTWEELEETLLRADVGVATSLRVLAPLRELVKTKKITEPSELLSALQKQMSAQLATNSRELNFDGSLNAPNIWLVVGVNGAGKTTTIGKISAQQRALGRTVLMAAGDTFRAAAGDQLQTWAQRSNAEFVRGAAGGDPSSVIFDGVARATAKKIDLVLADTAGRLQNNTNLMEELTKVRRVAEKGSGKVTEVLLVIDATTGQNGLSQAKQFSQATQVTGVVLTKLDGSAKGGIVFAVETELQIPVKLVGLGETIDDLVVFDPVEFVAALFA